jgi:hypothetical protein
MNQMRKRRESRLNFIKVEKSQSERKSLKRRK